MVALNSLKSNKEAQLAAMNWYIFDATDIETLIC